MKMKLYLIFLINLICVFAIAGNPEKEKLPLSKAEEFKSKFNQGGLSLSSFAFAENKGQVIGYDGSAHPEVKYTFQQGNTQIFLLERGIAYQFTKINYPEGYKELMRDNAFLKNTNKFLELQKQITTETYRMDMHLVGADKNAYITTEGRSNDFTNFYNRKALNVYSYNEITYHDVYPGIDWKIYTKDNEVKYDFVLKPGADPTLIKMEFKHQEELNMNDDGSFTLKNSLGTISEKAPSSFQAGTPISTRFSLNNSVLSFVINEYNKNEELIIDPALTWATYYGGASNEEGYSCATDASGNVYLSGETPSASNIASGGHQTTNGGGTDAFLVKFNSSGVRQWGTYYGGSGINSDRSFACSTDGSGNVFLTGLTSSSNNISSGGHQSSFGGGIFDAFLAKFNSSGVLQWGTYYGDSGYDYAFSCAADASGNIYLVGSTTSTANIASGGHQNSFAGGATYGDAFLVKFNSSGVRQWATYYGGADPDQGQGCATVASSAVFLSGLTSSTAGIASGGHQNTHGGGSYDAYLVKFDNSGVLQWATYYGGSNEEGNGYCSADAAGIVYLCGDSESSNNISSGGHQNTYGGTVSWGGDAFLVKFNASGVRQWGTYYGGTNDEFGQRSALDASGNVYLSGKTRSTASIASGGFQNTFGGGVEDAFLVKFNSAGTRQWGTYYGGSDQDIGYYCDVDASGNVYLAGTTASTANIASGGHQNTSGGFVDAFLAKFCDTPSQPSAISGNNNICPGSTEIYSVTNDPTATGYTWSFPGGWTGGSTSNTISVVPGVSGNVSVTANNACGASTVRTRSITVSALPSIIISPSSASICSGANVTLTASGGITYTWSGGPATAVYIDNPVVPTNYTVTATAATGCTNTAVQAISIGAPPTITISSSNTLICSGTNVTLTASGATTYTWSGGPSTAAYVVSPTVTTSYTVTGTITGCTNTAVEVISVNTAPTITISATSSSICSGFSSTLTGSGAITYTWSGGPFTAAYAVSPTITTTYTLTGTAANSCTDSAVRTISVNTTPILTITPSSTVICSGNAATLTASGASTYTWSGGPATAAYAPSPTVTTSYTVTGTSSGCTNSAVQSLSVNTSPTVSISTTGSILCSGFNSTLTASGATSYTWSAGPTTASYAVNPTVTTIYTVTGSGANTCTNSAVQTISVNTTPNLTITPSSTVICYGKSATITASGAGSYSWSGGPSTASYVVSPTITTSYTVTGGSAGCTNTVVQSISVITTPTVSISSTGTIICSGLTTTLTGNGANSYVWTAGPATTNYAVSPGTNTNYTVTGTAVNGCTASAVQQVSVNASPVITITPSSTVICSGKSATLNATGANTYTWSAGPLTPSYVVSPSATSIYTVIGTTAVSGCTDMAVMSISVNSTPTISISPSSTVLCLGKTAILTGLGGDTYVWSGGPTTATYAASPAVTTIFTLTGTTAASGCTNTAVQTISVNALTAINISPAAPVICSGLTSTLTASGVTTYTWMSGPVTPSYAVSPSITTIYTVTGTDAATGCTNTAFATVSVNTTPTLSVNSGSICSGNSFTIIPAGASTYTISGGTTTVSPMTTALYTVTGTSAAGCAAINTVVSTVSVFITPTVAVNSGSICTGNSFTMVPSGAASYTYSSGGNIVSPLTTTSYSVSGSSTAGCISVNTAISNVTVNVTPTVVVNSGTLCTGQIFTMVPTGASTYTFSSGSNTVNPIINTTYSVTGTSAAGCIATNTAVSSISVFITPTVTANSGSICTGNNFTIVPSGASTYTISGSGSFIVSPTAYTSYSIIGTSTAGCVSANTATSGVTAYTTPTITIVPTPANAIICTGEYAWMAANGASTYTWVSGPASQAYTVNPMTTTSYTVIGTSGSSGCTNTAVQNLTVNVTPTLSIVPSSTLICSGNSSTLSASGTNSYTWTPTISNFSTVVFSPSVSTIYTVIGTAANNCTAMAMQSVSVNITPTISINPSHTVICSGNTATFTAGGAASYLWNTASTGTNIVINPSVTTSYSVIGTTSGCTNTAVRSLSVNLTPTITITPSQTVLCSGKSTTLLAGGAGTYTWSTAALSSSISVSPSLTTNYTVNGTSASNNCTNTAVQTISVNLTPTVSISPSSTLICTGKTATFTALGADTYSWSSFTTGSVITISPSTTTGYTVTGTNSASGCTNTASQSLSVNTTPSIGLVQTSTVICSGRSVTITLSGANTYSWNTGANFSTIIFNPTVTTNYSVIGYATNNCTNSAATSISVNTTPTVSVNSGTICAGEIFTINPSGASTYTISGGSTTVSPVTNSVYLVSGTSTNGCIATNTPAANVFVNALPSISVNSGSICIGNSFTLLANGASTYTWDSGANTSSLVVSPVAPTVYTVTGTNVNNCIKTITTSVVALVIPNVSISGNTAVCIGSSMTLTANGATNFTWSPGAQTSSVIVVSPTVNTTYSVRGVLGSNSCSNTASQLITINPKPILSISGNTFVCPGSPLILTANGAATYTWVGGIVSTTLNVTPTISTTYSVQGTDNNGCSNGANFMVKTAALITPSLCLVTVDSLSINNEIYWDKTLFPRADTFLVYREYIATQYKVIARIPRSAFSSYVDTNRSIGPNIGNPNHSSYKYKLQYKDSCGNLSAMSPYHKTIKLDDYQTGNFSWNYYNIDGVDYQLANYYLWRYHVITGSLTLLGGTSGNSFTDPLYASLAVGGNMKWYVTTSGFVCNPSLKPSGTTAGKNGTKSNNSNERQFPTPEGVNENLLSENNFVIYPNPAHERFVVSGEGLEDFNVQLSDVLGRLIDVPLTKERSSVVFEAASLKQGIYFVKISRGKEQLTKKIIID